MIWVGPVGFEPTNTVGFNAFPSLISDFLEACKNYHKGKDSSYVAQNYVDVVNDRRTWTTPIV